MNTHEAVVTSGLQEGVTVARNAAASEMTPCVVTADARVIAVIVVIAAAGIAMNARTGAVPNITTADVTRGDFIDYIQIRGDIRPAKSIVLAAPLQAGGELQIVKLVANGAAVKKGTWSSSSTRRS